MKKKKNFYVILITVSIYILLSWIIKAGNFNNEAFASTGYNQLGILDLLLAPINLFNYFVVSMTKGIDGYINKFSYGNIIIAFVTMGLLYGTLNVTGAYKRLVTDIAKKANDRKEVFIIVMAIIFFVLSSLTGLELLLFMFIPFVGAILGKLKFNKETIFTATVGALLFGRLGSLYNPSINGLNQVILSVGTNSNIIVRLILFVILGVVLGSTLYLKKETEVAKEEDIMLLEDNKDNNRSYVPIIITSVVTTLILIVCMYNWYYMFNTSGVTKAYNDLMATNVKGYTFMNNIFGMSEPFGYWTGFTMSVLLIIQTLIIKFIYSIKLEDYATSIKKSISDLIPMIGFSVLALSIVVISLNSGNSFIYTIIDKILALCKSEQAIGVFITSLLHSFFINDYFALLSSLTPAFTTVYQGGNAASIVIDTQLAHGLISLVSPLNVYLVAGLTFFGISFKDWFKYIWKTLVVLLGVSIIILMI